MLVVALIAAIGLARSTLEAPVQLSDMDRQAIERVAVAEAGDQSDAGLAGVIAVIVNRLRAGTFGSTAQAIVNAPGQFEPVSRAGGDWRFLRPPSQIQRTRVETILNLVCAGALIDITRGSLYFQNPAVVAQRIHNGTARPALLGFGLGDPAAVIGAHAFYLEDLRRAPRRQATTARSIFYPTLASEAR